MAIELMPEQSATHAYERLFGEPPTAVYKAPGRVNLMGEHTDYNEGFVLPCAINYYTAIVAGIRDDRQLEIIAANENFERITVQLDVPQAPVPENSWGNYIRGVVHGLQQAGIRLQGANIVVSGNVPLGAGLSSSAALEIVTAAALVSLSGARISGEQAALIGQATEHQFCGCQCGIMDQLASALCEAGKAMLLDCRSLDTRQVIIPENLSVVIVNSNVKRGLVESEYNTRRQQCEAAARQLGVPMLRDVTFSQLEAERMRLDDVVYRRALHVVTENQRALAAADALQCGDIATLGELMAQSQRSMCEDFEITVPAIDTLVAIIKNAIGTEGGVRMTGGGFGGCVVALMPKTRVPRALAAVEQHYSAATGLPATHYVCEAGAGAFTKK